MHHQAGGAVALGTLAGDGACRAIVVIFLLVTLLADALAE